MELAPIAASTCAESTPKCCVCLGNVDPGNVSAFLCVLLVCPQFSCLSLQFIHNSWAVQHLVLHRFCGSGLAGDGVGTRCVVWCWFPWARSLPRALLPRCSHIPTELFHSWCFPGSRFTPVLCFAACLPCLITYLIPVMGLLPLRGESLPCDPFLQIPCVFLSWGSAQLWLLPVPLPYALTAPCSFAHFV